ncbi:protein arginine kinase [Desulfotomaculum copahuensis]|uniref:Protein-arginine kinase n=1 Tax=Desulfotomaculum copahuensis TaxID=1838280 RepID=A0A1B7LGE6_9FIRM|nr:protein arginine kinase [Desulfotomaculum copahuensis]OAT85182.1 protein arginine kinase [Desulfotomaculum copahuensis]
MPLKETLNNAHSHWMDGSGPEADIVISSRVRVARNLAQLPFPHLLSPQQAGQVIDAVRAAADSAAVREKAGELTVIRMNELTPVDRQILVEKHLISPDLLEDFERKAVVLREDEVLSVMINEEDHLRLQCLLPGLQLNEAWQLVNALDDGLEATLDYAFDEKLGYLTACPTNVGTGMRASVMLHLPGLVLVNQIRGVLAAISKLGLTVRGLYGEGTEAAGNLFQISNQITLGQAEEDIVAGLISVTRQLLGQERAAREALSRERKEQLADRVGRAYGVLKHACIMSSEEAMRLLSDLRLGINLEMIKNIPASLITELIVLTRPAFLVHAAGRELSPVERDVYRAKLIRRKIAAAQQC